MVVVRYGGKAGTPQELSVSDEYLVVRTNSRSCLSRSLPFGQAPISPEACEILQQYDLVTRFDAAGVEVLKAKPTANPAELRDRARTVLNAEPELEFAGRVLMDPTSHEPVVYTENLFVKFEDDTDTSECEQILTRYGLTVKRSLDYARNAYFVAAPEQTGLRIFEIAEHLLNEDAVELCHPEMVREIRERGVFATQWHLRPTLINNVSIDAHANVEAAWQLSKGENITIAIIDDGIDLDHEEFRGSAKIVAPRDVTLRTNNPRPANGDDHGTACAGVACANGNFGASGVAPNAQLMPIRLASGLGSMAEADAFMWAAQNGADVISCSWGPPDGVWSNPNDPRHQQYVPLPDSTRLAIDYAIRQGRNGKGCVILFAAGNGNESVQNDGYASYQNVIAVAACNDYGKRSAYSDMGAAVWCAFPSSNGYPSQTPGIWTTDRSGGPGYNPGNSRQGDGLGHYTNSFGGTSSACPGAAGVAALILARNPNLRWDEVRDIMKRCCDRIDEAGGNYNSVTHHSPMYGYGRLNAHRAVELAMPSQPNPAGEYTARQDVPIRDLETSVLPLTIAETKPIQRIQVAVDIEHTYIGDLVVRLLPPAALGLSPVTLHDRFGGGLDNLKRRYDEITTPSLGSLKGKTPNGSWTLEVSDQARADTGQIRQMTLTIEY
jgi:subtilisin family serine protease/subtilisin-like proprotein convertase family protein